MEVIYLLSSTPNLRGRLLLQDYGPKSTTLGLPQRDTKPELPNEPTLQQHFSCNAACTRFRSPRCPYLFRVPRCHFRVLPSPVLTFSLSHFPTPYRVRPLMSRGLEVLILLAVCGAAFFTGLGRHDYVKTEGLRAVVVEEMLERDGLSMPTVHGEPYLKKPPLYAWRRPCSPARLAVSTSKSPDFRPRSAERCSCC